MKNKLLRQNEVSRRSVSYRLMALFLFLFTTSLCFTVSSQETKITLKIKDRPLSEVLNQIESKSGYSILVRSNDVNLNEIVSVDANNLGIRDVLNELFKQSKISYEISGKNISVFKPQTTTQGTSTTKITPRRITGIVTDAKTGESIIGATVQVRGTGVGTVTDFDGRYSIEVRDANPVLVFSYVGYMSEMVQIAKQTVVDVKLSQDVKTLEEVVVVGYGTMKKSDITGSIASVKTQDLQAVPVFNVGQALKARVAGVNIT
ncbi:MAG: carboxypeptidase-like regulatory domain-containing protein, partial [Paludibacter sp.]|nr:carboxypeptidase-like regulatory domain-containing protein [Paludibacter sp.]